MVKPVGKAPVGVIGLGNMGRGIAANLAKAGWPVMGWDAAEAPRAAFEGRKGVVIAPPQDMGTACWAILLVVPGTAEIRACVEGRDGVAAVARKGLILCDLTTSDPRATQRLAARLAKRGIRYVDAGMSGGAAGAEAGTLTLMVGGDRSAVARLRPVFKAIAAKVHVLGPSGAGHTMKVLHQIVCHANFLAACETFALGERAGLKLADMVAVINDSNGRSYASQVRFPKHILSGKWDGRSRVYNLHKDLKMAAALARGLHGRGRFARATLGYLDEAMALGMAEDDFTLLYRDFERLGGKD